MAKQFLYVVILVSALFSPIDSNDACPFTCTGKYDYEISGATATCPKGQICNVDNKHNDCKQCINECEFFTCDANHTNMVLMYGVRLNCDEHFVCNAVGKDGCAPCIRKICETVDYECDPKNKNLVRIKHLEPFECLSGYECNSQFTEPCNPCIEAETNEDQGTTEALVSTDASTESQGSSEGTTEAEVITEASTESPGGSEDTTETQDGTKGSTESSKGSSESDEDDTSSAETAEPVNEPALV